MNIRRDRVFDGAEAPIETGGTRGWENENEGEFIMPWGKLVFDAVPKHGLETEVNFIRDQRENNVSSAKCMESNFGSL